MNNAIKIEGRKNPTGQKKPPKLLSERGLPPCKIPRLSKQPSKSESNFEDVKKANRPVLIQDIKYQSDRITSTKTK